MIFFNSLGEPRLERGLPTAPAVHIDNDEVLARMISISLMEENYLGGGGVSSMGRISSKSGGGGLVSVGAGGLAVGVVGLSPTLEVFMIVMITSVMSSKPHQHARSNSEI